MDWNEADEKNRKALRGIVALLLSLAALAECASLRSRSVCGLVVWLLRPAEDVARDYVDALTWSQAMPPASMALVSYDGPAEAMRLALSFRALAAILAALWEEMIDTWSADARVVCVDLAEPAIRPLDSLGAVSAVLAVERRDSS